MADWKRIVIGDAFKIAPGGINYYRDVFFMWPFLLFSICAILDAFSSDTAHRAEAPKLAACAAATFLLTKHRLVLLVVSLGYVGIRLAVAVIFFHDWKVLLGALFCGGTLYAIFRSEAFRNWTPSYPTEKGLHPLDLLVGVTGLGMGIMVVRWISP